MCGIAGFLGGAVGSMQAPLDSLAHRGPDDSGWIAHPSHPSPRPFHSVLLHRRLSILDLSAAGHQPMASVDGAHTIVFNGEIYNYRELREELENAGRVFRTQTDTEVLLNAYIHWGPACLRRLIGMFAFAVRDERRRCLFLARDFVGMKPLYYVRSVGGLAFASEVKALLDWLPLKRTVQPQRLYEYLRWDCTDHGGDTLWGEIRQVPAAHYLEVPLESPEQGEPVRYWNLPGGETLDISFDEAARRLREMFLQNIRLHLRSDVPVGAALSGGIDSSAIVAAMRAVEPSAEIHAFSYVADEPALSEERWVDLVGKHARAIVHKIQPRPGELIDDLDRLIGTQDEPFGSTSMYAQYCVFRAARQSGIKVMLDGQGADELLAGYGRYVPARLSTLCRTGRWIAAWRLARCSSRSAQSKIWLQTCRLLMPAAAQRMLERWMMPAWLNAAWFRERGVALDGARRGVDLRNELRQTVSVTSLPQLLRYEDRNSMASSVESRLPFLTPDLAEFLLKLPDDYILGGDGLTKRVFRQAMRGIVPDAILDRRDKIGFATPELRWLTTLTPWVEATLASERARSIGALDVPALHARLAGGACRAGEVRFPYLALGQSDSLGGTL